MSIPIGGVSVSRRKRASAGNFSISLGVAACRALDPDIGNWIELGDVVSHHKDTLKGTN